MTPQEIMAFIGAGVVVILGFSAGFLGGAQFLRKHVLGPVIMLLLLNLGAIIFFVGRALQ